MKLDELKSPIGATKIAKRKGRGKGTGNGKTAGRGHKGQKARSGGGVRLGFEGGQMPLYRRVPKRGFNNIFAKEYVSVNLDRITDLSDEIIDAKLLKEKGIISKVKDGLVILGRGEINKPIRVKAVRFSESANRKITEAGGIAEVI